MRTKKLFEETEQKMVNPNLIEIITFMDAIVFSNLFYIISVRCHSHTQVITRNVQWTFMGGCLTYIDVLCVVI